MVLAYGVLSAKNSSEAIAQICRAVGEKNMVIVHHDFSQQPNFSLDSDNAYLIQDYVTTSWGAWSQTEAILKILEYANANLDFDYLQLLSDSCLPVRPTGDFEMYLENEHPDACIEVINLTEPDSPALVTHAWRYYARNNLEMRLMRRIRRGIVGETQGDGRQQLAGLAVPIFDPNTISARIGSLFLRWLVQRARRALPPSCSNIVCGSTWICLSSSLVAKIIQYYKKHPEFVAHYKHNTINSDESFLHTIVTNLAPRKTFGLNHYLSWTQRSTGPDELLISAESSIRNSGKYFARKFSKAPNDALRMKFLGEGC